MAIKPEQEVAGAPRVAVPRSVGELTEWYPAVVTPTDAVPWALALCEEREVHCLPVVKNGRLVGVTCRHDLSEAPGDQKVAEMMKWPIVAVTTTPPIGDAVAKTLFTGVSCLPVVSGDERWFVGLVSRGDLMRDGLLEPDSVARCVACDSHHHVRPGPSQGPGFCFDCRDRPPPELRCYYEELGGG